MDSTDSPVLSCPVACRPRNPLSAGGGQLLQMWVSTFWDTKQGAECGACPQLGAISRWKQRGWGRGEGTDCEAQEPGCVVSQGPPELSLCVTTLLYGKWHRVP